MTSESVLVRDSVLEESADGDIIITDSFWEWLAPRISFSNSFTQLDMEVPVKHEESITTSSDFEFSMSASSDDSLPEKFMLTADELFDNGKLLPLPISSQVLTAAEQASSAEDQEATRLIIAAKETSDQASAPTSHLTSSDSSSSSFSLLFPPQPPKGSSSWNTFKSLFNHKKAEGMPAKGSLNKSAGSSKSSKFFGRGSPDGNSKAANTQNFCRGPSVTTSPVDRARTKPSQAVASLLLMPSQAICCSFPSKNQDEIATTDEAIDYERDQLMDSRSVKTVCGQGKTVNKRNSDSTNSLRVRYSSGKSASLPCSRMSSPERGFRKDLLQKGLESMAVSSSTAYNKKKESRIKMERCKSIPMIPGSLQNQDETSKHWDNSKFYQEKKGGYDWKPYSDKVITYPSGVRVAPVLNVPACLGPSLRKGNSKGNFASFKELFSRKMDQYSKFH